MARVLHTGSVVYSDNYVLTSGNWLLSIHNGRCVHINDEHAAEIRDAANDMAAVWLCKKYLTWSQGR